MSDVSEHSDRDFITRKKIIKNKENRGGHMLKCLLTELAQAGRKTFGTWSWRTDLTVRPSESVNKYILHHLILSCQLNIVKD